ncbi:MAG: serine hydrolase, partial [Bacteroidales bacterium]|nr:serine hydrolase [Bacteroidales bacterium]
KECILTLFGNPYALNLFNLAHFSSIIVGYEPFPVIVECAMDALLGRSIFEGQLPVSIHEYPAQSGITPIPEQNKFANALTHDIDVLVEKAIKDTIIPGCQIMAIHDGKVIFDKCYGYLTYEKKIPVTSNTLYDIASLTKVTATTLAVMKLYDEKKLKLSDKVSLYLPYLAKTNKANITLAELLTHTSGLVPFIPFYQSIANKGIWDEQYLSSTPSETFTVEVAKDCWLHADYKTKIHQSIADSKMGDKKYRYSDLNFLLLQEIIETITKETLDQYITKHFYKPLDLKHLCFNPLTNNFTLQDIAPTEKDDLFRKQLVCGYVHDQTAAIMGGVCGNAGLFANAHDLAVIFQMLSQDGAYQDIRYLSKSTVSYFKKPYSINSCKRRGLGFDVPDNEGQNILPKTASPHTYGHTGFTGTVVWCDPKKDLIYIFLSNRIYPSTTPNKLANSKLRLKVQEVFYKYIDE